MKRPQSAKAREYWPQISTDEAFPADDAAKNFFRPNKKLAMHAVTTNDLSRLLPKNIPQDKERLYSETLQLKNNLNQMTEENLKLKTKVAILEREKDRMSKNADSGMKKGSKSAALQATNTKSDKQNGIVATLKKIIRQSKQESEGFKSEVLKLKRMMRYTKINELDIEKQTLYEQNKKQAKTIQQLYAQLESRVRDEHRLRELESELRSKTNELKQVTADNMKYEELLQELQMSHKEALEKILVSEKKWQRDTAVEKRKAEQLNRQNQNLKREVKLLNEKIEEEKKKNAQKKIVRPASSHPYRESANSSKMKTTTEMQEALILNQKLKRQLEGAKKKLAQSENQLKNPGPGSNTLNHSMRDEPIQFELTKVDNDPIHAQYPIREEQEYAEDFQTTQKQISRPLDDKPKPKQQLPIMRQIRQILTYRMKYNRYPFAEIKADIEASSMTSFSYSDLLNMLVGQPFFLTTHYATQFLKVCYNRTKIKPTDELPHSTLLNHLRKVIDQFSLLDEEQQENLLYKLADFMTKRRTQLQTEFKKIKKNDHDITASQLRTVLTHYPEVSPEQIDLAICYVSAGSESLHNINYLELLDKFYMNNSRSIDKQLPSKSKKSPSKQVYRQYDELSLGDNQELDNSEPLYDDQMI